MKKIIRKNKGSILISALLFLGFTAFLVNGIAVMVRNQVTHFAQIKNSYIAKTLIQKSIQLTEETLENKSDMLIKHKQNQYKELIDQKSTLKMTQEKLSDTIDQLDRTQQLDDKKDEPTDLSENNNKQNRVIDSHTESSEQDKKINEAQKQRTTDDLKTSITELKETFSKNEKELEKIEQNLEKLIQSKEDAIIKGGTVQFDHGTVTIKNQTNKVFLFTAVLKNDYVLKRDVIVNVPDINEIMKDDEVIKKEKED